MVKKRFVILDGSSLMYRAFYALLEAMLPDWRERKTRLKEYWQAHYQLIADART